MIYKTHALRSSITRDYITLALIAIVLYTKAEIIIITKNS